MYYGRKLFCNSTLHINGHLNVRKLLETKTFREITGNEGPCQSTIKPMREYADVEKSTLYQSK